MANLKACRVRRSRAAQQGAPDAPTQRAACFRQAAERVAAAPDAQARPWACSPRVGSRPWLSASLRGFKGQEMGWVV